MTRHWLPAAQRLAARLVLDVGTGCLLWTGPQHHNGYGALKMGREQRAHRVAYILAKGPIPVGLQIDHLCRTRLCCNPDHLECVTREENIARGNAPHMVNARKTHCIRGHEFTPSNTMNRRGQRVCRACRKVYRAARLGASRDRKSQEASQWPNPDESAA